MKTIIIAAVLLALSGCTGTLDTRWRLQLEMNYGPEQAPVGKPA
jgi:hypothetical protein